MGEIDKEAIIEAIEQEISRVERENKPSAMGIGFQSIEFNQNAGYIHGLVKAMEIIKDVIA